MKFTPFSRKRKTPETAQGLAGGESSSGDQTPLQASGGRRQKVADTLDATIQIIQQVTQLVPINTARNILTGITSILLLVQKSMKNKDDLHVLIRNCKAICSTLALATKDVSVDRMSDALSNALSELKSSIDDVESRVEEVIQHDRMRRFLAATLDEKQIASWAAELNTIFVSFSTRLNIVSSLRLEQIYELLKRSDVPNLMPEPPPPPPAMFFGREHLFSQVKDALLRDEDVVLIGPGGIGKSCLSKALINDDHIQQRYMRRFFVSYDSSDPMTITSSSFLDRIATALGVPMLGAESKPHIISNLVLSSVLLVLDNAETFEDAANPDTVAQIASIVSEIANTPRVTVILTSRTSRNARLACWTEFDVPPLEKEPARIYFRKIYHGDIADSDIDGLLGALDFHPLSIHIIAHAARESRWTGQELLDEWHSQQGKLLQTGHKKENLGFTIQLSLNSPSVKDLGDDALNVLHIIAFFPQGINRKHTARLFSSIPHISSLVNTLCQVSLVHRFGPFLTILAPIRLFLLDAFPNAGLELLGTIRRTFYDSLLAISKEKDLHASLLASDHLNIEHLIAYDSAHALCGTLDTALTCRQFLLGLKLHKLRPTILGPIISSLSEDSHRERDSKASCLSALADLYFSLSNYALAGTVDMAASTLFVAVGNHHMAALCTSAAAMSYNNRGYFSRAQQLLEAFTHSSSWQNIDEQDKVEIYFTLDWSRMRTSPSSANGLFLRSIDHSHRGLQSRVSHWMARMYHGYTTPEVVENNLKLLQSLCMSSRPWDCWIFLEAMAEAASLQRRLDLATELLNQAYDSANGDFLLTLIILYNQAAVASVQGNYELAQSLLQRTLDTLSAVTTPSSIEFLEMRYVYGRNELYAKNYSEARRQLSEVVTDCDLQGNIRTKIKCTRALGEVEISLGHKTESEAYFAQTVKLCREAGEPPELLGICEPMTRVGDDEFPGWRLFLQARPG